MKQHIVIIGGGLVGSSLACALEDLNIDITLIESVPFDTKDQPSFDGRTIALTYSSGRVLESIGLWSSIKKYSGPIHRIHVSNKGHMGFLKLDRSLIGIDALGYVAPTRKLGLAISNKLAASKNIRYICPAEAEKITNIPNEKHIEVKIKSEIIKSSLVVLADGGRSPLSDLIGLEKISRIYEEKVLIGIVTVDRDNNCNAYERFTKNGPLALLPLEKQCFALAWTLSKVDAKNYLDLPDEQLLKKLQECFGDRVGFFTGIANKKIYDLNQVEMPCPIASRMVAIGNTAHTVHPVAGQGFNLGLRDVAELAENISEAILADKDIGDDVFLANYAANRKRQTKNVHNFTDGLLKIFSNEYPGLRTARNIGLNVLNISPFAKRILLRRTSGLSTPLPRLSRGLPLKTNHK